MILQIKNMNTKHMYCSMESNIVPPIGSIIKVENLQSQSTLKVRDVVYNFLPNSNEIVCDLLVLAHSE